MKYVIVEDEEIAVNRLKKLVHSMRSDYVFIDSFDSIKSAVPQLAKLDFDLLFMDVQLADGISFEILEQVYIDKPIIFTTAYDEYAIRAFKTNSIDYLLKPISAEDLLIALNKFETLHTPPQIDLQTVWNSFQRKGKERFVVKVGDHLKTVETTDISLVFSRDKGTYLVSNQGNRFLVDYTMDKMEELLDSDQFFRISRKFIVSTKGIADIIHFTNSRLEIKVHHYGDEQIIVARERVNLFKSWLDR